MLLADLFLTGEGGFLEVNEGTWAGSEGERRELCVQYTHLM